MIERASASPFTHYHFSATVFPLQTIGSPANALQSSEPEAAKCGATSRLTRAAGGEVRS
jgi:hypothetical protein